MFNCLCNTPCICTNVEWTSLFVRKKRKSIDCWQRDNCQIIFPTSHFVVKQMLVNWFPVFQAASATGAAFGAIHYSITFMDLSSTYLMLFNVDEDNAWLNGKYHSRMIKSLSMALACVGLTIYFVMKLADNAVPEDRSGKVDRLSTIRIVQNPQTSRIEQVPLPPPIKMPTRAKRPATASPKHAIHIAEHVAQLPCPEPVHHSQQQRPEPPVQPPVQLPVQQGVQPQVAPQVEIDDESTRRTIRRSRELDQLTRPHWQRQEAPSKRQNVGLKQRRAKRLADESLDNVPVQKKRLHVTH